MSPREEAHKQLMESVLKGLAETPLVLKGGTGLLLGYGLDRFSEDLDFDSSRKMNLESKIRRSMPQDFQLHQIHTLKNTDTVTRYRANYSSSQGARSLKLEVSYRTPAPDGDVRVIDGIRIASLPRILDQKLRAAHDGQDTRTKVRDLYDIEYIARRFPAIFDDGLAARLKSYSAQPDELFQRYQADWEVDELVVDLVELDHIVLGVHLAGSEMTEAVQESRRRLASLPDLAGKAGAAFTFWEHAQHALQVVKRQGGNPGEADWQKAEVAAMRESIGQHGQDPHEVAEMISRVSPGAVLTLRQQALQLWISSNSDDLRQQYKATRDHVNALDHDR